MPDRENPASRVHRVISKIRENKNPTRAYECFAQAINLPEKTAAHVIHCCISQFLYEIGEVQTLSHSLETKHPEIKSPLVQLQRIFVDLTPGANTEHLRNSLTGEIVLAVAVCIREFDVKFGEDAISAEELGMLRKEVEELIDVISSSEIEYNLKVDLIDRLESLRDALLSYAITGVRPIRKSFDTILGNYAKWNGYKTYRKTPWYERYCKVAVLVSTLLHIVDQIKHLLPDTAHKALPPGQ